MPTSINLHYRDARSDKVYHAQVVAQGDGYVVEVQYGRRGSTLQHIQKPSAPVPLAKADDIITGLLKEKIGKGYLSMDESAAGFSVSSPGEATGLKPQLLNPVEPEDVQGLVLSNHWVLQPKHDGRRQLAALNDAGDVCFANRRGLKVQCSEALADAIRQIGRPVEIDGELEGDRFTVFDLLALDGQSIRNRPYRERLKLLYEHVKPQALIVPIATAEGAAEKQAMLERLRDQNAEGVVFKNLHARFSEGRPASGGDQLKFRFYAQATAIVARHNDSARSIGMEMLDEDGRRIDVGNVTVPPNQAVPEIGSLVEVRYLYAYPGGSLFQPLLLGVRDDVLLEECVIAQLKYKAPGGPSGAPQTEMIDGPEMA